MMRKKNHHMLRYNPVPFADFALKRALDKKDMLTSPRELVLIKLVLAEIERVAKTSQLPVYSSGETVLQFYLLKGYVTFRDIGISHESQSFFLEHGVLSPQMLRELEAVPSRLAHALAEGEDRKDEYQHSIYIPLTHRLMSLCGI